MTSDLRTGPKSSPDAERWGAFVVIDTMKAAVFSIVPYERRHQSHRWPAPADGYSADIAQASMQHSALDGHDDQPFSVTYCDIADRRASVSSRRFSALAPPSAKLTAASDCAIAIAPVRLGKNPGEDADS